MLEVNVSETANEINAAAKLTKADKLAKLEARQKEKMAAKKESIERTKESLTKEVSRISKKITNRESIISNRENTVKELETKLEKLSANSDIDNTIQTLNQEFETQTANIEARFKTSVDKKFAAINRAKEQIEKLTASIKTIEEDIKKAETRYDADFNKRTAKLDNKINAVRKQYDRNETMRTKIQKTIDKTNTLINIDKKYLTELNSKLVDKSTMLNNIVVA